MLSWIFGDVEENIVHLKTPDVNSGSFRLKHANVRWFLSINYDYIPTSVKDNGLTTFRSITIDGEEIEFSGGFKDLHTRSYEEILKGNGFGLDEAYSSIRTVSNIRNQNPIGLKGEYHPFCKKVII
jgi:UDP-N-acetyl-2-amino-2-deoxyglucuronate dehydrogenase